jgi:transcriptional regulator with GAF, ATPase, and Fis domain
MIRFEICADGREPRLVEVREPTISIGSAEDNEVVVDGPGVAANHVMIEATAAGVHARQVSPTGAFRLKRSGTDTLTAGDPARTFDLASGDQLILGDDNGVTIRVELEETDTAQIVSLRHVDQLPDVEAAVGADHGMLQVLYAAQKNVAGTFTVEQAIDALATEIFQLLPRATHVTAMLANDDEEQSRSISKYVPVASRVRGRDDTRDPVPLTRSVVRKVLAERAAVLAADAKNEVGETASMMAAEITSTMGVPLWQGSEIIGVLQVDNRAGSGIFRERDLDVLSVLAQSAGQAFAHARLYQRLRVAEDKLRKENAYLKRRERSQRFEGIVGDSRAMNQLFEHLRQVVDTRVTVLIEGETGTGKELIASAVHYWSDRREKLLVAQNCAALPENLLESELFGHRRGAFTGALEDKKGLFELADQGTLFLDEVTEMPLTLQAKLLRALQEGEIRPLGSNQTRKVDVRIVAATNRELEKEVAEGRFREDLYYRLKVFPLRVPPLRERREDIPLLVDHFLKRYSQEFGKAIGGMGQQAMELLQAYPWPGNVRELENEIQRLVIQMPTGGFVAPQQLSARIRELEGVAGRIQASSGTLKERVEQVEKWIVLEALREHGNNKSATAKTLGITREGLHKKLKALGIN